MMTESLLIDEDLIEDLSKRIAKSEMEGLKNGIPIYRTRAQVDRFNGLKVEIFSNEHGKPHFRVKYQGSAANYLIEDCSRINGNGNILLREREIKAWWMDNQSKLISKWNEYRPSDCTVGIYRGAV